MKNKGKMHLPLQALMKNGADALLNHQPQKALRIFTQARKQAPGDRHVRDIQYDCAVRCALRRPRSPLARASGWLSAFQVSLVSRRARRKFFKQIERRWIKHPFEPRLIKAWHAVAEASGKTILVIQALEKARAHKPEDFAVLEHLAHAFRGVEQIDKELACRERIVEIRPHSKAARADLKDAARRLTAGASTQAPDAEEELRRRIEENPANVDLRLALAKRQLHKRKYTEAIQALETFLEQQNDLADERLEKMLFLAREHQLIFQIAAAEDDENQRLLATFKQQREHLRIEKTARMVERSPNDLQLRFDYGRMLLDGQQWDQAIEQFNHSAHSARRRTRSLVCLSKAYLAKGQPEAACNALHAALAELPKMTAVKKDVLHRLASILEFCGNPTAAKEVSKQITRED